MDLIETGGSWSGRERNCCFLNTGRARFADVSAVTGLDFVDDGRAVAVADWDHDGDLDLWLGNRTAPRIRFMRNNIDHENRFLKVLLIGRRCNRDAIGARLELFLKGQPDRRHIRSVRAGDGFLSQSSRWVHFGLGKSTQIERLVVNWPGGPPEEFTGLDVDTHYRIVQGSAQAAARIPPAVNIPSKPSPSKPQVTRETGQSRMVLMHPLPMPGLNYESLDRRLVSLADYGKETVLINLWATWCVPCLGELKEFVQRQDELTELGVRIVALSVDGLRADEPVDDPRVRQFLKQLDFPFAAGFARHDLVDKLDVIHDAVRTKKPHLDDSFDLPVPTSFLVDRSGRLAVIYKGSLSVEQLLADVAMLHAHTGEMDSNATPLPGRWFWHQSEAGSVFARMADRFLHRGYPADAERYASLIVDLLTRDGSLNSSKLYVTSILARLGDTFSRMGKFEQAALSYRRALKIDPYLRDVHERLNDVLEKQKKSNNGRSGTALPIGTAGSE